MTRIIILTGAPGVGKTETGRRLISYCPKHSALIDTDALVGIYPWVIDDVFYQLLGKNLRACIGNYVEWGAKEIVISGVIIPDGTYKELHSLLEDERFVFKFYGLQASHEVIERRIAKDPKSQNPNQRLQWLHLNEVIAEIPGITLIDTENLSLHQVVETIVEYERADKEGRCEHTIQK